MPLFQLQISAELENLTNVQPQEGCDDPTFSYRFKLRCENCGEVTSKETCVILSDTVPLPKGRESAHLVQKCKFCGREGNIKMIPGHGWPLTLERSQAHQFATLMVFDCRGFEPIEFFFGDGWHAESIWGTKFEIDFSEGDFMEYDGKGQEPVSISDIKASFVVTSKLSTPKLSTT